MIRPPHLRPGHRVMLVAPAGPASPEKIDASLERCAHFGFEAVLAPSARRKTGYLAGPDAARAADLQIAIDDDSIDAIWAIRGGYGAMRLLSKLDFGRLRVRPKPFIGFSDNTTLHLALAQLDIVSFHGPHSGAAFPSFTEDCFVRVLMRIDAPGVLPMPESGTPPVTLHEGVTQGELLGGNLALLAASCGTPVAPNGEGKIIFIEDVGEPLYRIDRMLTQLALAGVFDGAAGIAFGKISEVTPPSDQSKVDDLLRGFVEPFGIPAVSGLPFGHIDQNWTLPFGVRARLDADAGTLELLESAVTANGEMNA